MHTEYQEYKRFEIASNKTLTPTPVDIEGPFYKANAPFTKSLDKNPNLHIHGKVYNTAGETLANCTLDFWQANAVGVYDMDGFNYRGKILTDAEGNFAIDTIVPGFYKIGTNEYRCAHVHVKVSAPGYALLTTQLYFEDDKYDSADGWFNPQMVIGRPDGVINIVLAKI